MSDVQQVGGSHYHSDYQHWDWAEEVGLGSMEYAASKYLVRWREKGGLEDLKKSLSYIKKLIHLSLTSGRRNRCSGCTYGVNMLAFRRFIEENAVPTREATVCILLQVWRDDTELDAAAQMVEALIEGELKDSMESDLQASSSFPLDPVEAARYSKEDAPDALPPEPPSIYAPEPPSLLAEATLRLSEKRDTIPSPSPHEAHYSGELTYVSPQPIGEPLDGYVDQDRQSIDFPF